MQKIFIHMLCTMGLALLSCSSLAFGDHGSVFKAAKKPDAQPIANFTGITLNMAADVLYIPSPTSSVRIFGADSVVQTVTTEVVKNELKVGLKSTGSYNKKVRIEIASPELNSIVVASSGDVEARKLQGKSLHLVLAGSGHIKVSGMVENVDINSTGSGSIDSKKLKTKNLKIDSVGSGNIAAAASDSVSIRSAGAGDVVVHGAPQDRKIEKHGVGEVIFK